jgi:hypothetical protein
MANSTWDELAWNGIRFLKPPFWDLTVIGERRLILETRTRPALEIQWAYVGKDTLPVDIVKKLPSLYRGKRPTITKASVFLKQKTSIESNLNWSSFVWKENSLSGFGVVTVCPVCGTGGMFRFYGMDDDKSIQTAIHLINSFTDHESGNALLWAVFDIRACIPKNMRLSRHRFSPGAFTLSFSENKASVTLYRFGPASHLLSGRSIEDFAMSMTEKPMGIVIHRDPSRVEWEYVPPEKTGFFRFKLLRKKEIPHRFRLWHVMEMNRVLGIHATGRDAADPVRFNQIATDYVCIPV